MASRKKRKKNKKTKSPRTKIAKPQLAGLVSEDLHSTKPGADFDTVAGEIRHLMAEGKSKSALSLAKTFYKKSPTDLARDLLVETYISRILELGQKGYAEEARILFDLAQNRYGLPKLFQIEMNAALYALTGDMDGLLEPLSNPSLDPEEKAAIHKAVQRHIWDLRAISNCEVLSRDHSLRKDADALWKAFDAVTRDDSVKKMPSLSGISRRSPLASWKMVIGALEAFYGYDDARCEKLLNAVDLSSAPGRLVPVLRAMLEGDETAASNQRVALLMDQVFGNDHQLQKALSHLDGVMGYKPAGAFFAAIKRAVNSCKTTRPELVEKLRQHIFVRCGILQYPERKVEKAMGGVPLKNAYYWRLLARAEEAAGSRLWACAYWDQFFIHAVHQQVMSPQGSEPAALYHHIAELLNKMPDEQLEWEVNEFRESFEPLDWEYREQPKSIKDVFKKASNRSGNKFYYLYPETLYQLACKVDPVSENFAIWFSWTRKHFDAWQKIDPVALLWHETAPGDIRPLLYLIRSAEKRNALQKALGYLNQAESLDRLSPDVKRARKRLMVSISLRHLTQKKTHLARKDFQEMEDLPQFKDDSGRVFLTALKGVSALMDRKMDQLDRLYDQLVRMGQGRLVCHIVLEGLFRFCGLKGQGDRYLLKKNGKRFNDDETAAAFAAACLLYREMGIELPFFPPYVDIVGRYFKNEKARMAPEAIRAIAEAALAHQQLPLAYAASGTGLARRGPGTARFLLLRAQSLPQWAFDRRIDCKDAVLAMARHERDSALIDAAMEFQRIVIPRGSPMDIVGNFDVDYKMDFSEVEEVIHFELEAADFPQDFYMSSERPNRGREHVIPALEEDDWDDEEEWDYDLNGPFFETMGEMLEGALPKEMKEGLPREAVPILLEMVMKYGMDKDAPDLEEVSRKDPELMERFLEAMGPALFSGFFGDIDEFAAGLGKKQKKRKKK